MTTQADAAKYNISGTTYYYIDIVGSSSLSLSQMEEVYQIFRYSNPQYYFLKSAYLKMELMVLQAVFILHLQMVPHVQLQQKKVQSQVSSWQKKIDACSTDEKKR